MPAALQKSVSNYTPPPDPKVKRGIKIVIFSIIGIMVVLSFIGQSMTEYGPAQTFANISSFFMWILALVIGYSFAYNIARPRKSKPKTFSRYLLTITGFVFGFIPGLILAFIIAYPLSKHACELSGSKYC
jgi:uncharacterized membrane protein YfcA